MGGDPLDEDLPTDGDGAGPPDDAPVGQDFGYEEAEALEPDLSLADPAVMA